MSKITKQISPARAWCFTLNNWTEKEHSSIVQKLLEESDRFLFCVGKEIGKKGTPHLQGAVYARDSKYKWRPLPKFSVKRDGVECSRWKKMDKCFEANYNYCKKDGDFVSNYKETGPKPSVPDWCALYYFAKTGRYGGPKPGAEWCKLWHLSLKGEEDEDTKKKLPKWLYELYEAEMISDWDI